MTYRWRRQREPSGVAATGLPIGDTFTDVDATNLTAHTPTGANPGASWTTQGGVAGDLQVRNNELWSPTSSATPKKATLNASGAYGATDYTVAASMRFAADPGGVQANYVMARAPNGSHGGYKFGYNYSGQRWELYRMGAAADGSGDVLIGNTTTATYAAVASSTHTFSLQVSGTTITCKVDGTNAFAPVTDATFGTGFGGVALNSTAINGITFGFYLDTLTIVTP